METVELTRREKLCISCGICAAVCPAGCISFERSEGYYYPLIVQETCLHCGKCLKVCPGYHMEDAQEKTGPSDTADTQEKADTLRNTDAPGECLSARTLDEHILGQATSGGVITTLVKSLLDKGEYDVAFLAEGYDYSEQMQMRAFRQGDSLELTQRSRYLPVSEQRAVTYLLEHPQERVIYVGTGCAVHGLLNALKLQGLTRERMLVIGLFCDRTMTYQIYDYMKQLRKWPSELICFHFRDKSAGGWPGNIRLQFADGTEETISAKERMIVKDYFQARRCLYCHDKLNRYADLAVGDNYTGVHADPKGSSSVILYTESGRRSFALCRELFEVHEADYEVIRRSQHMEDKKRQTVNNQIYAQEHEGRMIENTDVYSVASAADKRNYRRTLAEVALGESGDFKRIRRAKEAKRRRLYLKALAERLKK